MIDTFDGPFYSNGEWIVIKKEAAVKNNVFTLVDLKLTLQRRTTIYTYFIVLPYLLSVLFILIMMTVQLDSNQKYLFAGCSIFIQLSLIMLIISHIGFWTAKAPRSIRCISINILFTVFTICLSTLLTIRNEKMKSTRLPSLIDQLLNNNLIGRLFILDLDAKRLDNNLMPFINEDDNANANSIEILQEDSGQETNESSNILVLEKDLNETQLSNLKRWILFRTLIERLLLYIYIAILVIFHI